MQPYMHSCISGIIQTVSFSAFMEVSYTSAAAAPNFSSSYSSRTKALTMRIPVRFSWTAAFILSYFRNICWKYGKALLDMNPMHRSRIGMTTANTTDSGALMEMAIISAMMNMKGARTIMRINIW